MTVCLVAIIFILTFNNIVEKNKKRNEIIYKNNKKQRIKKRNDILNGNYEKYLDEKLKTIVDKKIQDETKKER